MRSSKIYSILEHFDKYEQNRFRKYLSSPYFNKDEKLLRLLDYLLQHINSKKKPELNKENIWDNMKVDRKFDDVRFRKYCSDLLKHLEGFLAQQVYEENPLHQATYLMTGLSEKKLEKLYKTSIRSAKNLSDKQQLRPASFYYYQYEIEKNYYELIGFEIKRTKVSNVEAIANNLDYFFLAEKLRYYCTVLSRRKFQPLHKYEILFMEEIINHLAENDYENVPPVAIYYQIYLALAEDENPEHYFKLKSLLEKYGSIFPNKEASNIYTYALNYCTAKINQGSKEFLKEFFDLYKDMLEKEIIIERGQLNPWHFRNLVTVALRLKKYDWTEEFINTYSEKLPEELRKNAVTYNLAQLYFYEKKYELVMEKLRDVEFDDISYNLNSKTMLIATYYELDEIEPLQSLNESFRTYLNRHKDIPSQRKAYYLNLIRFTKKIVKTIPGNKKAIEKIKVEVDKNKNKIASEAWLREKIAELG